MKTLKTVLILITFLNFTYAFAKDYKIDASKSKVIWTGYAEAGGYAPEGTLMLSNGSFAMVNNKITSGEFEFDMKTISQENKDLEKHLKNEDFFDVEKFPKAFFKITKISTNQVSGILTIKEISKPITFPIEISKVNEMINVKGTLKIDRTLYEIKYNSSSYFQDLGSYAIKNQFDIKIDIVAN